MNNEPSVKGEISVARIPGSLEMYLITRMADWDGALLPVVLGHARTRQAAIEFARNEANGGCVWVDSKLTVDSYVRTSSRLLTPLLQS